MYFRFKSELFLSIFLLSITAIFENVKIMTNKQNTKILFEPILEI